MAPEVAVRRWLPGGSSGSGRLRGGSGGGRGGDGRGRDDRGGDNRAATTGAATTGVAGSGPAVAVLAAMADPPAAVAPVVPAEAAPEVRVRVAARPPASRRVAHPVVRPVSSVPAIGPATSTAAVRRPPTSVCPTVGYRTDACRTGDVRTVDARTVEARTVDVRTVEGRIVGDRTADRPIVTSARHHRPVCRSGPTNRDCRPRSTPGDCRGGQGRASWVAQGPGGGRRRAPGHGGHADRRGPGARLPTRRGGATASGAAPGGAGGGGGDGVRGRALGCRPVGVPGAAQDDGHRRLPAGDGRLRTRPRAAAGRSQDRQGGPTQAARAGAGAGDAHRRVRSAERPGAAARGPSGAAPGDPRSRRPSRRPARHGRRAVVLRLRRRPREHRQAVRGPAVVRPRCAVGRRWRNRRRRASRPARRDADHLRRQRSRGSAEDADDVRATTGWRRRRGEDTRDERAR